MRFLSLLILHCFLLPCAVLADSSGSDVQLAVCIPPQADLARALLPVGSRVEVLLPSNANHETFEPTMGQLLAISRAGIFIKVGHPKFTLETLLLEKLIALNPSLRVVDGSQGVTLDPNDIHYWTSPKRLLQAAKTMSRELQRLLPAQSATIETNEHQLLERLSELDRELQTLFNQHSGKAFLVFHPSWGYLAEDYRLRQLAIEKDGKEAGVLRINELLNEAEKEKIHTVFIEPGTSRESVHFLAERLGAEIGVLNPLADNWLENLLQAATLVAKTFEN